MRNLRVGDVILIQYATKSFPGTHRIGRVIAVELDTDNLVRTCAVKYHLCKSDATTLPTKKEIRVPSQRLMLILPVEEQ